ncbi:hypothetical protein E2C01_094451 [Portunus trituberculatus]|uniref:Uncharacterized protein n=1 Tax=Portunus trituberculatus TaxID=210409 RepID=A0A5B7JXM1_PORTR|nr:hypothetical protein [Portunus trituberculatus]
MNNRNKTKTHNLESNVWRRRSRGIPVRSPPPSAAFIFESDYKGNQQNHTPSSALSCTSPLPSFPEHSHSNMLLKY